MFVGAMTTSLGLIITFGKIDFFNGDKFSLKIEKFEKKQREAWHVSEMCLFW